MNNCYIIYLKYFFVKFYNINNILYKILSIMKLSNVMPQNQVKPVNKILVKQKAQSTCIGKDMSCLNNEIDSIYHQTTAYDLNKRHYKPLLTGSNSLINRFKRWKDEKYVIIEQNKYEILDKLFSITLLILTIILIYYAYIYELTLVPKSMTILDTTDINGLNEKQLEDYNNLKKYNQRQFISDIIKGISAIYVIGLGSTRCFKRTTI